MYAVIETGGKQYRVTPGEAIEVETLAGDSVLKSSSAAFWQWWTAIPLKPAPKSPKRRASKARLRRTAGATRLLVFKFKRKKQYKRTIGHRQNFTRVTVSEIVA